jgi:hypothetical protein
VLCAKVVYGPEWLKQFALGIFVEGEPFGLPPDIELW